MPASAFLLPPFGAAAEDDLASLSDVVSLSSSSIPSSVPSSVLNDTPPDTESDREEQEQEQEQEEREDTSDPTPTVDEEHDDEDVSELFAYAADDESTDDGPPPRRLSRRKFGFGRITLAAALLALLTSWMGHAAARGGGQRGAFPSLSHRLVHFGAPTVQLDCARVIHLRIKPKLVRRFPVAASRDQKLQHERLLLNAAVTRAEGTGATTLRVPVSLPQLLMTIVPFLMASAAQDAKGHVVRFVGRMEKLLRAIAKALHTRAVRSWRRLMSWKWVPMPLK